MFIETTLFKFGGILKYFVLATIKLVAFYNSKNRMMLTKKTIFLDFHPDAPKPKRAENKLNEPKVRRRQSHSARKNQNKTSVDPLAWQLNWMQTFDSVKRESNDRIDAEVKRSLEKESEINRLSAKLELSKEKIRKRNEQIPRLFKLLSKRKTTIRQLKKKLKEAAKKKM